METVSAVTNEDNTIKLSDEKNSVFETNENPLADYPSSKAGNQYDNLLNISKEYYNKLKEIDGVITKFDKNDIIVLNNLINEINSYCNELISIGFIVECAKLNQINLKINDLFIKILNTTIREKSNQDKINFLKYPFSLKLCTLEIKFHLLFSIEKNYSDSEKFLFEILNIQNKLKMPRFNIASSTFYLAIIKFCKNLNFNISQE